MLIAHKEIARRAKRAGYEDVNDYGLDHDLARCEICGLWGLYGDEITMDSDAHTFCDAHALDPYGTGGKVAV